MKSVLLGILGLVLMVGLVLLAVQNPMPVEVDWVWGKIQTPVWLALICAFSAGLVIAFGLCATPLFRYRIRARRQRKRISSLEQEIHGLRTLPLIEEDESNTDSREV